MNGPTRGPRGEEPASGSAREYGWDASGGRGWPGAGQRPKRWPTGFVVCLALFGLVAVAAQLVFSFGMLFAVDGCGAGTTAAVCDPLVWCAVVALPWFGLAGTVGVALGHAARSGRLGRSPWPSLALGIALYGAVCAAVAGILQL